MGERWLKIEEVAALINSSVNNINNWYMYKRLHPEEPLAQMLPDYIQPEGKRQTRYWSYSAIPHFLEFKASIIKGRNGKMGEIIQRWAINSKHYPKRKKGRPRKVKTGGKTNGRKKK